MKSSKKYIWLLVGVIFLGCETPISIEIPNKGKTKIIEGWIENDQPAVVIVSNSLPYFSKIDTAAIFASIDRTATVKITDDMGNSEQLQLGFSLDHIFGVLGGAYVGKNIKGIPGHTYTLYVESGGKTYTSQTYIPDTKVQIDSFELRKFPNVDTAAMLRMYFHDNPNTYDCYRFFLKIKDLDLIYSQIVTGTFDDLTFNGIYGSYELMRRPMSNLSFSGQTQEEWENYNRPTFRKGDIIYIKSTMTDVATQKFWFPLQTDIALGMNPMSTPEIYPTNIEGENVTGIWSGYNVRYDTVKFE